MNIFSKTTLILTAFAGLTTLTALPASAQAAPFSFFGTGVDASGTPLPSGTPGDPHYMLTTNPEGTSSQIQVLTSAYGFPIVQNAWIGDSATSAWIAPTNDPFVGLKPGGLYDYQTTFDLTNFDPATASLSGSWAMDNYGTILLNGVDTGNTWSSNNAYGTFAINSGFQSGLNTVDFLIVDDGSGTTGLRVDGVSGSANPVPEASTTVSFGLLLALGLGAAVIARRKRTIAA